MAEALTYDTQALRRTQSTGDLPPRELLRPARARISIDHRRSEHSPHLFDPRIRATAPEDLTLAPRTQRTFSIPIVPELPSAQSHAAVTGPSASALHRQRPTSWYSRAKSFFGYGPGSSRTRKSLVSFMWNLGFGFMQIVATIVLLAVASYLKSPTSPDVKEINACGRPLVAWNCIWLFKVTLSCILAYWSWRRACASSRRDDTESNNRDGTNSNRSSLQASANRRRYHEAHRTNITTPASGPSSTSPNNEEQSLPYSHLYARLSLFSSIITLTWFLTAHILEYTSINTCRQSAPHVWWLTFAILCTMYITVLEVFFFGLLVFIVLPTVLLFYNIALLCLGRHPLQNPHYIKPEVKKLPKSLVDRIPLVIYIPPPPDDPFPGPIPIPKSAHSYPPKPVSAVRNMKRRFAFLRKVSLPKKKAEGGSQKTEKSDSILGGKTRTWEDSWEQGEYPFVRLEGNRAVCAICLMDFEEPKKTEGALKDDNEHKGEPQETVRPESDAETPQGVPEAPEENIEEEERPSMPHLEDAGEGPSPLRLLACGHVFHQPCIDPWLTEVSGRCPICQRPVEIEEPKAKKSRRGRA
ncbi:hypothetical protein SERLA73DRAFT_180442 [Serpula lacrymans var. lacrymans S7.3]|uniref:RING-type domain-containing protein n=2 Tax=Serpula lacrymans var. lacrymans TaxID=341189 RepID=F8PUL3_SERL3|nr:uncharacterized protein SERLADRAFT_466045 [Serpula lacrymans var. lacrymans S7.9]EGO00048.1 hypothetical protein SERLA73DRAFT_180442 [Serpula lacrymans var. lacrymans S7.3]EGO25615.1 hypothetical protein SERLADRAFT_466045 [Serpula lacrymans var. lacrymans S7.9]